jgi:glutamate-ammonia-ligase adenylyltransferase
MALTRARPVYGSTEGRAELQAIIDEALRRPRDARAVIEAAGKMRGDIAKHKPPAGPFDIKLVEGGLVDLEFAVHTLQLTRNIGLHPQLERALVGLAEAGLVPEDMPEALRLLTRMLVTLRLVSPTSTEPPPESRELVARACGQESWSALLAAYDAARQRVRELWLTVSATEK